MRRRQGGFSLVDLLFSMVIIAVTLIPMAGIFPMGHVAVQKARLVSIASALAHQRINEVRASFPVVQPGSQPTLTTSKVTVGPVDYTVVTQLWPVAYRTVSDGSTECYLADVQVQVAFRGGNPFEYTTRVCKDSVSMQSP